MWIPGLLFSACTLSLVAQAPATPPSVLAEPQKAQAIAEAMAVIKNLGEACQRLDVDAATKDWMVEPNSLVVGSEGQIGDPSALRESLRAFYANMATLHFTTIREEGRLLAPDLVLVVWCYKVEGIGKKGSHFVIETEAASFLLRKRENGWKVIFFHESASPTKRLPAPAPMPNATPS